jgi:hypothetical protein
MFTVYFDAGGSAKSPKAMFVSGFVSRFDKWLEFETDWHALLAEYDIKNPFHMKDFAPGAPPYDTWKDDKPKRQAFLESVLKLMSTHTMMDFSQGIKVADLNWIRKTYEIPKGFAAGVLETPFSWCGVGAYTKVVKWVREYTEQHGVPVDGDIELVYDRGEGDWGHFSDIMRNEFAIDPIRRDKAKAVPIQLADILAYEHARYYNEPTRPPRIILTEMADLLPGEWVFATRENLQAYCESKGFPKKASQ